MQLRYRVACIVAAVVGVGLTVMRLAWTSGDVVKSGLYTATLCVLGLTLIALFSLCGVRRRALVTSEGKAALFSAAASAWVGASLLIHAIGIVLDLTQDVYPYPQPVAITTLNTVMVVVMVIGALFGGVFFVITAVRWFVNRRTDRAAFGILALGPVVWTWARLLWYITSFASAVNRYRSVTETLLLVFDMLFLLAFARYASGVEEKTPRFAVPIALCTAMMGFMACFTRFGAYILQDGALFSATALLSAPDLAIAVVAAVFVGQQLFAVPLPTAEPEEEETNEFADEEDEEAAAFLLDMESLPDDPVDDEEDDVLPEGERRPLELEDIINDILNRKS